MTMRVALAALLLPMALGGCKTMSKVPLDAERLSKTEAPKARLACPYRLGALVDARPAGASVGSLGWKAFTVSDPIAVVRDQLAVAGLRADGQGVAVDVRLMQFYLTHNTITLVPVVVYEVTIAGHKPVVVRGSPASMNDWGSDNEATKAYMAALRLANAKLITSLNAACR